MGDANGEFVMSKARQKDDGGVCGIIQSTALGTFGDDTIFGRKVRDFGCKHHFVFGTSTFYN